MKKIISGCLLVLFVVSASRVAAQTRGLPPVYYIDSQRVDLSKIYLDVDNIEQINVVNELDTVRKTYGGIYLTLKRRACSQYGGCALCGGDGDGCYYFREEG
jgi:hypothetical protein